MLVAGPARAATVLPWGFGLPPVSGPLASADTPAIAVPVIGAADPALALPAAEGPIGGDRGRALDCLTLAIAYEAGNQPLAGQQAVGEVILNRVRDARFPKSVCGVVFAGSERLTGCQFTFTCDGSIRRRLSDATMLTARGVAASVLDGLAPDRVGGATHYHADYVLPYWAWSGTRVARIGAHIFYRMPGARTQIALPNAPEPEVARMAEAGTGPAVPVPNRSARRRAGVRLARAESASPPARGPFMPWGLTVASPR